MSRFHPFAWALASVAAVVLPALTAFAQGYDGYQVPNPPPPLPYYDQPPPPGPDYIWTPGFWGWDDDINDYYWVQGSWVLAPRPGYLWTPGYWAWNNGYYGFHNGYWGPHVGYYGGVDYGFGYTGYGFEGGYWSGPHYVYNRAVNNVGRFSGAAVYNKPVGSPGPGGRVSFSGGPGGVRANPTPQQLSADHESHIAPTSNQIQRLQAAQAQSSRSYGPSGVPLSGSPRPWASGAPGGAYRAPTTDGAGRFAPPAAGFGQAVSPAYRGYAPSPSSGPSPPAVAPPRVPTGAPGYRPPSFDGSARFAAPAAAGGQPAAPTFRGYAPAAVGPSTGAGGASGGGYRPPPAAGFGQSVSPAFRAGGAGAPPALHASPPPPPAPHGPPAKSPDAHHGPQP